jgi:Protein of unknown function (DUF3102)
MAAIPEAADSHLPRVPCAETKVGSEPLLPPATRGPARNQLIAPLNGSSLPDGDHGLISPVPGRPATVTAIPAEVGRTAFDYGSLPAHKAEFLRKSATRIRQGIKSTVEAICDIGVQLCGAKLMLGHGQFVQWVESESGFSLRSAQNYMRASAFAAVEPATVALLAPATVYRLSAKSSPPEVVAAVLARAASGQRVSDAEVVRMLRATKQRWIAENKARRAGPPRQALSARGDAHSAIAKANARALLEKFGRSGAVLLLGMQENILETLAVLAQEVSGSNELGEGGGRDIGPADTGVLLVSAHQLKPRVE